MTTRAELRGALRRRLEDAGPSPLWDDTTLNEALAGAVGAHGARFPKEAVVAVPVAAGATRAAVAAEAVEPRRIVRVLDETGAVVPRAEGEADDGAAGQAVGQASGQTWRWWDGTQCWTQSTRAVAVDGSGRRARRLERLRLPCSGVTAFCSRSYGGHNALVAVLRWTGRDDWAAD